jgi:hypothetical protein
LGLKKQKCWVSSTSSSLSISQKLLSKRPKMGSLNIAAPCSPREERRREEGWMEMTMKKEKNVEGKMTLGKEDINCESRPFYTSENAQETKPRP